MEIIQGWTPPNNSITGSSNQCLYQNLLNKRHLVVCWCFNGRSQMQIWLTTPRKGMNCIHFVQIHTSDNLFCSNSLPILELSLKFASQICHENINKPLDGAYLADFGIDISHNKLFASRALCHLKSKIGLIWKTV